MMKGNSILFLGVMGCAAVGSLAATVKGVVTDISGQELPGASVQLIALPDSVFKSFSQHNSTNAGVNDSVRNGRNDRTNTGVNDSVRIGRNDRTNTGVNDSTRVGYLLTDVDGGFEFSGLKPGRYYMRLSMTGMDEVGKDIEVRDSSEHIDLGKVKLSENSVMLGEALVTAVRAAVVAKQDTLEFNAGSFHTNPNASVEDLLKKLPGVEVGSDGSITSGGKSVTKILVDGKEFFADDPKMATKNLPSNMVDKVQVVERKSETARLTGVDDGEDETVINLTVKKDMNNGWFGTVSGGYGTDDRYQGNFNINWFKNGNQVSIIGGGNNINEMGFTDMGRGRFRDFGGNNGINSTQQFGINFNVGNEEKFRIGGNVLYTHSDRDSRSRFDTQYLFPDSVSYLRGGSKTRDRGHSLRAQFRMQWNISEADMLDFRPEFSLNMRHSELKDSSILRASMADADKVNSNYALRGNRGTDYTASGRLIYTHKFLSHPGRSLSAQFNYTFSNTKEKATTWNDIEYYLRQEDSERLFQFLDSHQWSNQLEGRLTWTEPLGDASNGNFLEVVYKASLRFNNADKLTYDVPLGDYDPETSGLPDFRHTPEGAELSQELSNRFRNKFSSQELQIGYKKANSKYNLNAGVTFSPSSSSSEDFINPDRNIDTRWVFNVAPYLRFRYKFSKTSSLSANYRARTSQPSLTQLQPVADVSDPLNIKVGNPDLKPTFTQNIGVHFNNYNAGTQQSIFAVANASFALNNIVSRTLTDPETGVRTTTYANANGNWNVFGMFMLNQPFRNRKWRVMARFNGRYSSAAGYINGEFNRSGNLMLSPTAGMTFSSDIFQMTVNPTYSFSMATSTLPQQENRYTHSYGFDANASLYLPFGLEVSSDLSFSKSTGYSQGFDNTQWLWNAQLSYSVLKDKSLTFSVRAYDLLGQKKNVSRSVSANMITDNEYNDLRRYVMFGVTWKFNTLSKKAATNMPPDMPSGRGMRGGGGPGGGGRPPMGPPPGR